MIVLAVYISSSFTAFRLHPSLCSAITICSASSFHTWPSEAANIWHACGIVLGWSYPQKPFILLYVLGLGLMIMVIKIGIGLGFVNNTNMEMISIARLMMTLIVMKMKTM